MGKIGGERVGEPEVQLLEQNVKHNMDDIRDVKKRLERVEGDVHDLKTNQQVTNQNILHVMDTLSDLKAGFKELDGKFDATNTENLKQYKTIVWQVGATIIGSIIIAVFLFVWNI